MEDNSGVEISMTAGEMKDYVELVIKEILVKEPHDSRLNQVENSCQI